MKPSKDVPAVVLELPADKSGNGFMVKDQWQPVVVGPDDHIYNRYRGIVVREEEET
jgi:hypothetical protein